MESFHPPKCGIPCVPSEMCPGDIMCTLVWIRLAHSREKFYFSAGTSVSWDRDVPPIPTPMCTEVPAKKTNFDRDLFLSWSVPVCGRVRSFHAGTPL
jgi:hypothetical protein